MRFLVIYARKSTLNAHDDVSKEATCRSNFDLSLHLHPYFVYASPYGKTGWMPRPQDYKTVLMLSSAEHKIYPAHKC